MGKNLLTQEATFIEALKDLCLRVVIIPEVMEPEECQYGGSSLRFFIDLDLG